MSVASLMARGNGLIGTDWAMSPAQRKKYLPRMARGECLGRLFIVGAERGL